MTDLTELAGSARSDVLPGYILSPLRLPVYGELQRWFEATYLRTAAMACEGMGDVGQRRIMDGARADVTAGKFRYGTREFDVAMTSIDHQAVLLWMCLREKHPAMTLARAGTLLNDENRAKLAQACLALAGYVRSKKREAETGGALIGAPCTASSANEGLGGERSTD